MARVHTDSAAWDLQIAALYADLERKAIEEANAPNERANRRQKFFGRRG